MKNIKRNKVILYTILLLIVGIFGYSLALYQIKSSKQIIYNSVNDLKNNKYINLAIFVNDKKQENFSEKNSGYLFTKIECDNNYTTAKWNKTGWGLNLTSKGPNECSVYFNTKEFTCSANKY